MTAARSPAPVSVDDYLAGEFAAEVKHEYIGGFVYVMAGARNAHNLIAGNFFGSVHARLRGLPCQPFNSDTKVRIQLPTHFRFYYPDGMVVCTSNPPEDSFQDHPVVITEVLSRKTRRVDEGEKREAYFTIPSLRVYLMIEQDAALVTAYRRTDQGFVSEVYEGADAVILLDEIEIELPLAEVYERVEFVPEPDDEVR